MRGFFNAHKPTTPTGNVGNYERGITMSETMIKSIVRTARGHLRAGLLVFENFGKLFLIDRCQNTNTYAILTMIGGNRICIAHFNA